MGRDLAPFGIPKVSVVAFWVGGMPDVDETWVELAIDTTYAMRREGSSSPHAVTDAIVEKAVAAHWYATCSREAKARFSVFAWRCANDNAAWLPGRGHEISWMRAR